MKNLILLIAILALSSCAAAKITVGEQDKPECEIYYTSLFKDIDQASLSACGVKAGAGSSRVTEVDIKAMEPIIELILNKMGCGI